MRLAVCFPDVEWLDQILGGEKPEAAFIQQKYITSGLSKKHPMILIAPQNLHQVVYQDAQGVLRTAPQTWSASLWYTVLRKIAWRSQKLVGIPYLNVFSNLSRYDALLRILPGCDLAYERNSLYNASVAMACRRLRLPFVLFFDADQILELDFMGKPVTGVLRRRAESILKYNLRVARSVICVSEPAKRHLIERWGMPPEKIRVFPNGVDIQFFRPAEDLRAKTRQALRFQNENTVFLFVGSFYKWHDVPTLLKAFAQVLKPHPLARLLLVGSGEHVEAMENLACELNIREAVTFTGLVPHREIPNLINAADIAIAPVPEMDRDLWLSPMKLFEYMASGVAIIASSVGQIAEVIEDGRNGLLVPPGDPQQLALAMEKLIADPRLRKQLGERARKDAEQKYSWDQYVNRLENLFQTIVQAE